MILVVFLSKDSSKENLNIIKNGRQREPKRSLEKFSMAKVQQSQGLFTNGCE